MSTNIYVCTHAVLVKFNLIDICTHSTGFCYTWLWYFDIFEQFVMWFRHVGHVFLSNLLAHDNITPCMYVTCDEVACIFMVTEFLMNKNSNICSSCQTFSAQSILQLFTLENPVIKFFFDWFTLSWGVIAWNQYRCEQKIWNIKLAESELRHAVSTSDNARQAQFDRQAVVSEFERPTRVESIYRRSVLISVIFECGMEV